MKKYNTKKDEKCYKEEKCIYTKKERCAIILITNS